MASHFVPVDMFWRLFKINTFSGCYVLERGSKKTPADESLVVPSINHMHLAITARQWLATVRAHNDNILDPRREGIELRDAGFNGE